MFRELKKLLRSVARLRLLRSGSVVLAAFFATATAGHAMAAGTEFPQQRIKLVLPFSPGSGTDGTARILANEISIATGQTVIVENKAGANGFVAADAVARAAPTGYTLLLTSNTHIANKFLYKKLPYDPIRDFKGITLLKEAPLILVVGSSSPFKSLEDVIAKVRQSPGAVSFGSGNSSSRVAAELFSQAVGSSMLYVPYKANPEALTDLMAGRVDVMFSDSTSVSPLIKAGRVRALVSTGSVRLSGLPNVPTTAERGLGQVNIGSWLVVLAPAQTPDAVIDRLNALFVAALKTDNVKKNFALNEAEPKGTTRAELDKFMSSELSKWGDITSKAGIQPQ